MLMLQKEALFQASSREEFLSGLKNSLGAITFKQISVEYEKDDSISESAILTKYQEYIKQQSASSPTQTESKTIEPPSPAAD